MIGIITIQRGIVKGDAQAGLSLLQEILVASIGLLGGAEAGEHAHRPELSPITGGMDATKIGVFAGKSDVPLIIEMSGMVWGVNPLDRQAGDGGEIAPALRVCFFLSAHLTSQAEPRYPEATSAAAPC
ncbi:MAG: hypothetical protein DDT25_01351 [Chloroflexi bacterium]|nr:hypothetical protein [Chloroflexota bacterium]